MVVMIGPARMSAAASHRPEPDLHGVEATGNTIRCDLLSGLHVIMMLQVMEMITPTVLKLYVSHAR